MKRLDKQASRQRWAELRDKWNEYDPIGIMDIPECPAMDPRHIWAESRLLEQNASVDEIVVYLHEISDCMNLKFDRSRALEHSAKFIQWYQERWRNTKI